MSRKGLKGHSRGCLGRPPSKHCDEEQRMNTNREIRNLWHIFEDPAECLQLIQRTVAEH
jgi:hypothetical protein